MFGINQKMIYEEWTCKELKKDSAVLPEQRERWGAVSILALWVRDLGHINVLLVIRAAGVYLLKRKELLLVQGCWHNQERETVMVTISLYSQGENR